MKLCCVGYRKWALRIYKKLKNEGYEIYLIDNKSDFDENKIRDYGPDFILFYGWSWIIEESLINDYLCIMLHPSPLPKYRGGSPIQNQIINGERDSAVSLFIMDKGIDTGDIIGQEYLSLEGDLKDILKRITRIGFKLTIYFLENGINRSKQKHSEATYFARRKEEENEITVEELNSKDGTYLINKIRMLQDPYPNAFFKTIDGKKLKIKAAELE